MFKTLIILYARSFWVTASRPNRGRSFAHWPASMLHSPGPDHVPLCLWGLKLMCVRVHGQEIMNTDQVMKLYTKLCAGRCNLINESKVRRTLKVACGPMLAATAKCCLTFKLHSATGRCQVANFADSEVQ
jgi:hypothetical protein